MPSDRSELMQTISDALQVLRDLARRAGPSATADDAELHEALALAHVCAARAAAATKPPRRSGRRS